jgi:hypothetical protein
VAAALLQRLGLELAPLSLRGSLRDRQAQAGALLAMLHLAAAERLEDDRQLLG